MGSIRTAENIAKLVKLTETTLQLPISRLNVAAFQYVTPALTLNTAVVGIGGVDVAISANSLYYCYAVVSSGVVYLIASLNASLPAGFTQARMLGYFFTDAVSALWSVDNRDVALGSYKKSTKSLPLTVTGSGVTPQTCVGIFYTDSNFVWRLRFNVRVTVSTSSNVTINFTGLLFTAVENQVVTAISNVSGSVLRSLTLTNNSGILIENSVAITNAYLYGDVVLKVEPTTYTIAANMELVDAA